MKKSAQYIQRIEIDALWSGRRHVAWDLRPDVNILSGVNGVGKSTILKRIVRHLMAISKEEKSEDGVTITYSPSDCTTIAFDVVRSFDHPVISSEMMNRMAGFQMHSELDFQLYQLQRRFLDYQVNLSNRMVELFTTQAENAQEQAAAIAGEKTHFYDLVDSLFGETGKTIDRASNEIQFCQHGETISPVLLSSGEKQMLIIMLTALVQKHEHCVLFMDEPEVSLHIEWQQRLIGVVRDLNPNAQIILTTHSPAVIMDGWADCVTDVEDIVS